LSTEKIIEEQCARFGIAWTVDKRPEIVAYLNPVSHEVKPKLLKALITLDIRLMQQAGRKAKETDYLELGEEAVEHAKSQISFWYTDSQNVQMPTKNGHDSNNSFGLDAETRIGDGEELNSSEVVGGSELESKFAGRYRLIESIGSGGMGEVWLAEQFEPFRRKVALKFIKTGRAGSKNAIARFEAERQAIAMMDHPNIAKILDAGSTADGVPYFVMELVNGTPLNKYCDENRLSIRERLKLMIPVCRAVQHAHQKGIIHRDLKHSNVLVTVDEGRPIPKVIDFGLAKALGHQNTLTDKSLDTEYGKVVGTLQYMSPEQAETGIIDVDTRSDVYSLGVMIFKLLTGGTPIQSKRGTECSIYESLRRIRESEPKPPSKWLAGETNADEFSRICDLRSTASEKFSGQLKGDLDWIVLKAIAKERHERYQTANGLALEIQRFLDDEKVDARPPSTLYTIRKFVRRNRGLVASLATVAILLIAGIATTGSAMFWALEEKDKFEKEKTKAVAETAKSRKLEGESRLAQVEAEFERSVAETRLHSIRMGKAWSDWELGNIESAWSQLSMLYRLDPTWEVRYLRTEFDANEDILYGFGREVVAITASDNGKYIAAGALDCSVKVWNAKTQELLYVKLLDDEVTDIQFSPDGSQFAISDRSNSITICNSSSGNPITKLKDLEFDIRCLAYSSNGKLIFAGESVVDINRRSPVKDNQAPKIHVIKDGKILAELAGHQKEVSALIATKTGELFSASQDGQIKIWENKKGNFKLKETIVEHRFGINCLAVSPDGKFIVSGGPSPDTAIRIWDRQTGELIDVLAGHTDSVKGISFSKEGLLASVSDDRKVILWSDKLPVYTIKGHYDRINDVVFNGNGDKIITASADLTVRIWNSTKNNERTFSLSLFDNVAWDADFSNDGSTLAAISENKEVAFMDVATGSLLGEKIKFDTAGLSLAYSHDSKWIATGWAVNEDDSESKAMLRIFNAETRSVVEELPAHEGHIWCVSFSPDDRYILTASTDQSFKVWDTLNWSFRQIENAHDQEIGSARFSNDGKSLVTCADDKLVKIWNTETLELEAVLEGHSNKVWRAVFSPDDKTIASSGYDGEIIIWDLDTETIRHRIAGHTAQTAGLVFSNDGNRLVSASDDGLVKFWDSKTGAELFALRDEDKEEVVHVSFSRNGNRLVVCNAIGMVKVLNASAFADKDLPFLPQDCLATFIDGINSIESMDNNKIDFAQHLKMAIKCTEYFPEYRNWTYRGICEYRLGKFKESIKSLDEATRLESIQYGESDVGPDIEGFLTLALFQVGEHARMRKVRKEFEKKSSNLRWREDEAVKRLVKEVEDTVGKSESDEPVSIKHTHRAGFAPR